MVAPPKALQSATAAGAQVVRGVETGLDTLRRLEFTAEPGVMGMGGGPVKLGVKPPVTAVEGAAAAIESSVSGAPLSLGYIESGRAVSGTAIMSCELTNPPVLMRGSHMSAGKVPLEVAEKLSGKEFASFDAFRRDFWKNMAESSYAKEFAEVDILRMQRGAAPRVHDSQRAGGRKSYELHHRTPMHDGGAVYDLSNILIVTPKYHLEILEDATHFKRR